MAKLTKKKLDFFKDLLNERIETLLSQANETVKKIYLILQIGRHWNRTGTSP